ncbi:MAG: ArsR family transcriptional regulator [Gammaproteobacteria bacterium]|jgi:DNA-binding transcriptional ArsR family regulator|nr:ArsR family transcriptional regulator [Gammaproteobacteria bacterium]
MMNIRSAVRAVPPDGDVGGSDAQDIADARLDQVFAALSDPIRRRILQELDGQALLVSELAAPFNISLQGVSRHIQVLVRAGLVQQERSGRISRCTLEAGPLLEAAVWLNRYAKYWQGQFDLLAATLAEIDARGLAEEAPQKPSPHAPNPQGPSPKRNRSRK